MSTNSRKTTATSHRAQPKKSRVARVRASGDPPPKRRSPAQQRSRATVDVIVEAAAQLLVESGRAAVTTNAVAARAGVSIGSLYQYFPNKQAIFDALRDRHVSEVKPLIHHALTRLSDPSLDLVDGIMTLMKGMVELHKANPRRMKALVDQLEEHGGHAEVQQYFDATTRLLCARTRKPADELRPTAWLATIVLTQVGRTLVHDPPQADIDDVFHRLEQMLHGLFSELT